MVLAAKDALDDLLTELVPDKRTTFCEVALEAGILQGLAPPDFEKPLYDFAAQHKVALRVTFKQPTTQKIALARAALRKRPDPKAELVSEAVYGETVNVFDQKNGFVCIARQKDNYLGWTLSSALSHHLPDPSHLVSVPRAHIFTAPEVEAEIHMPLSLGAKLQVLDQEGNWFRVALAQGQTGFVKANLLQPLEANPEVSQKAVVKLAARFIDAPYVWGATTAWGLDCSGLVQTVYGAFGMQMARDSDQQSLQGQEVSKDIEAADLLFFPGHVAIAISGNRIIHANAHHMRVSIDEKGKSDYANQLWNELQIVKRIL